MKITDEMVETAARAWVEVRSDPNAHPAGLHHWMRAALEAALGTEDDTEWEYGLRPSDEDDGIYADPMPSYEVARKRADNIRGGWGIVRRRKAGPWEPVPTEGGDA